LNVTLGFRWAGLGLDDVREPAHEEREVARARLERLDDGPPLAFDGEEGELESYAACLLGEADRHGPEGALAIREDRHAGSPTRIGSRAASPNRSFVAK